MNQTIELMPDPHLLESMRAVGYTVETALADIIDNSIAAGADRVDVLASGTGDFRIAVLDDGSGMDRATALSAMRLAAQSPGKQRNADDLGRFGLGLKTASLSQARRLTVATRSGGITTVLRWDLDHVMGSGRWEVLDLGEGAVPDLFGGPELAAKDKGTLVLWEGLDLFSKTEGDTQQAFDEAIVRVRSHCELVFHRFVTGDGVRKIDLRFNGTSVAEIDPFLRRSRATTCKRQTIRVAGEEVPVQAFTLPYVNKMTPLQRRTALAHGGLRDSQGFYIYRAGRLVVWGTWFRLNPKSELGKLARVQVDIPNSLDSLWALDIKKSQATPPREIRERLRALASQMIVPSKRVHEFRGRAVKDDVVTRLWNLVLEREGRFRHEVNRDHPLVARFADSLSPDQLSSFADLLAALESTFPVLDAHNRLSQDAECAQGDGQAELLVAQAMNLRPAFAHSHPSDEQFILAIKGLEPFSTVPDIEERLRGALADASRTKRERTE